MKTFIYLYQNYEAFYDKTGAGITGPVKLKRVKSGITVDLSSQQWIIFNLVVILLNRPDDK
jgi:hypothetical protein